MLVWLNKTHRTPVLFVAAYKTLLGEVCDVSGKYGEHIMNIPIGTVHEHAPVTSVDEWIKDLVHSKV